MSIYGILKFPASPVTEYFNSAYLVKEYFNLASPVKEDFNLASPVKEYTSIFGLIYAGYHRKAELLSHALFISTM